MLVLKIKKKWFEMIASGEKKEEYREIKPYWVTRFNNELDKMLNPIIPNDIEKDLVRYPLWMTVYFRNVYGKNRPTLKCKVKLKIKEGREEWGAEKRKKIYCIRNIGGICRWKIKNDVEIVEDIHFVKEQKELVAIVRNG